MTEEEVKSAIKAAYAAKAEESDECYPYCFSLHCARGTIPEAEAFGYTRGELESIPEEALMGLGCGNPLTGVDINAGDRVLDLGSGGGIDSFLAAGKVGPEGQVIGIDVTEEMVNKARLTAAHYGYQNVEFELGEIENLSIESNSVEIIISNCAINLSLDKSKVFQEAFRVLKPGGRLSISDTAVEEELPRQIRQNLTAWTGHVAGALTKHNYLDIVKEAGFGDVNILSEQDFDAENGDGKVLSIVLTARKPER